MRIILTIATLLLSICLKSQTPDTIQIKCKNYELVVWASTFNRFVDSSSLAITCGYINPVDQLYYSCNDHIIAGTQNIQDGSGCCAEKDKTNTFLLDSTDHYLPVILKKYWYSRSYYTLIIRQTGKINVKVKDPMCKKTISTLKSGNPYICNLVNK